MKLIILFNGWGMDEMNCKDLEVPKGYELKIVNHPYTLNIDSLDKFSKIIYIGWSFGAYYLSKFISENRIIDEDIIAINGHSEIIGRYGINPKMLNFTLESLTPDSLKNFYYNMDVDEDFLYPKRDFDSIKKELKYFCDNYQPIENCFTLAFIGRRDRIVPESKQVRFFEKNNVKTVELDCGHYPFKNKDIITKILGEMRR